MDERDELAESSALDAAEQPDADPNGFAEDSSSEDETQEDYPIKLPKGLTELKLKEWARKKKTRHQAWFGDNNGYNEKILDWWKAYQGKMLAGQSNTNSVPICSSIVETDMAKTYQALTARAKVVDAQPLEPQVNNENKTTVEDLINQEILWSQTRTGAKLFSTLKGVKVEGTGVGRVRWEDRWIKKINPPLEVDPISGAKVQTKTVVESTIARKAHGPNWDSVPVQNLIWDNRVERLQDSDYVAERQFPSLTDLLIMQDEGKITNVDAIERLPGGKAMEQKNPDAKRKQLLAPGGNGPMEAGGDSDEKMLDEWFAFVPYKEEDEQTGKKRWTRAALHFMIVNDEVLIMCEDNPWVDAMGHGPGHPYFGFRQNIVPRMFLGTAVHAPVMEMQTLINNTMASATKLVNKAAKNPTFVSRAAGLDSLRLFTDELSVIPVLDASQINHHPIDGAAIEAVMKERSWLINITRETVAASEQAQGVPTTTLGSATATEASIINANSGMRFQLIVDQLNYEFYAEMANLFWWMIRQWMQEGELVVRESTIDGAPHAVSRADLVDDYYFVPITAAVLNDQRAVLQMQMQFAQQVQQLQATNAAALTDQAGKVYHFDLFDFMVQEIMPKLNIRNGRTYMKEVVSQPAPLGIPGMPPAGGPTLPQGAPGPAGAAQTAPHGVPGAPPAGPHQIGVTAPGVPVAPIPSFSPVTPFQG